MTSYIYCVSNPYLTNLIKVGETSRTIPERLKELNNQTTTVCDFKLEYYIQINSVDRFRIEKEIHNKIVENGYERIKGREFFKCSSEEIKKIFESYSEIKYELIDTNETNTEDIIETNTNIINNKYKGVQYQCDKCNKIFNKKSNYLTHINKKFECDNNIIHKCKRCYKEFNKKSHYDAHVKRKIQCKSLNQPIEEIYNHINDSIHENTNIKDNQCPHCLKEFYQKGNAIKHIEYSCKSLKNKLNITEVDKLILKRIEEIFQKINAIK